MGNHSAPPEPSNQSPLKQLLWYFIAGLAVFTFFSTQFPTSERTQTVISYSAIKDLIRDGDVTEATREARAILAVLRTPTSEGVEQHRAITPQQPDPNLLPLLENAGVTITAKEPSTPSVLLSFLPWILILAVYLWISRRMMGGGISGGLPGGIGDFLGGRYTKRENPPAKSPSRMLLVRTRQSARSQNLSSSYAIWTGFRKWARQYRMVSC